MITERQPAAAPEAIDEYVFPQIDRVKIAVSRDTLPDKDNLLEQKRQFLAGEISEPHFTYCKNKQIWYDEGEIILLDLKHELIVTRDLPELIRMEYLYAINEKIARIRMLREIQLAEKDGRTEYHAKRFDAYSRFIYGAPDPEIFANVIGVLQSNLAASDIVATPQLEAAQARLEALIVTHATLEIPDTITPFPGEASEQSEEVLVDAAELKKIFEDALGEVGLASSWKVEVDKTGTRGNIAVNSSVKKIRLPNSEQLALRIGSKKLTKQKIAGLIEHEIKTHAVRQYNGSRSGLKLLGSGLRNYIEGEEGLASYREQQETKTDDYNGFSLYFAAGLAKGLDGGGPRAFADVHKILTDYYFVKEKGKSEKAAADAAWNVCLRIFAGTTGTVPGMIFAKDITYRKGNIATWHMMNDTNSEQFDLTMSLLDYGKFDPTSERQRQVVAYVKRSITEADLIALDEN